MYRGKIRRSLQGSRREATDKQQQEKRYRSMQEHIRRAHPDYYIPKLPATGESFQLMITTPPTHRPPPQQTAAAPQRRSLRTCARQHFALETDCVVVDIGEHGAFHEDFSGLGASMPLEGQPPTATNAAVALTQLHGWENDFVSCPEDGRMQAHDAHNCTQDVYSDADYRQAQAGLELPSLRAQFPEDTLPAFQSSRPRELLPSILQSPGSRYSSLPPVQRRDKPNRPRKPSMGENARKGKHERGKSKEFSAKEFSRRLSVEGRKAMSAEPPTAAWMQGKRWEDLIEAATSATEADDDRDLTPVSQMTFFDCPLFTCCCQEIELL